MKQRENTNFGKAPAEPYVRSYNSNLLLFPIFKTNHANLAH